MKILEFIFKDAPVAFLASIGFLTVGFLGLCLVPSLNYIPKLFAQWVIMPWIFGH